MKFAKVPNMKVWEQASFDFLESIIRQIESKYGRLKPLVVSSMEKFNAERGDLLKKIEESEHFRYAYEYVRLPVDEPRGDGNIIIMMIIFVFSQKREHC